VLLGDPPIEWDQSQSEQDLAEWKKWMAERDSYPADLIRREVLAKQRRALLIYGGLHLQRKNIGSNYEMVEPLAQTVVSLVERAAATKVFTVWTHTWADLRSLQADVPSWQVPSLAIVRGTVLGAKDFASYFPSEMGRLAFQDGRRVAVPRDQWRSLRMEDQFDAVLYLGPPSAITFSRLSPARCADADYMATRLRRMALMPGPPGSQSPVDRLKQYCASVAPK
jgi:hypothetical protein